MKMQHTLNTTVRFNGIGLHTGCGVNVCIQPAPVDTGIIFKRVDLLGSPEVKAEAANVIATSYATSLGRGEAKVSTIEHLMAAFYGVGVDNAVVEIDGPEVPIMDGSASFFIEQLEDAGLRSQSVTRKYIVIKKPIKVSDRDKYVLILPADDRKTSIDYHIDFAHTFLSKQSFSWLFSREVFRKDIGNARTFGFLRDVEALKANGLAKGGSLNNAVVIGETAILNEGGLRHPDEFVRHKVLDLMGDISLIGAPVIGRIVAHRSGHALNHKLVQEILRRTGRWELTDTLEPEDRRPHISMQMEKLVAV